MENTSYDQRVDLFCLFVGRLGQSFLPIVDTMKTMTATPSSMERQLSSIERRPYFLAPATSPVCSIDLDYHQRWGVGE